jgi:chromosomal replication initiation ATPase DnaA
MIRGISPSAQDKWVKKAPAPKAPPLPPIATPQPRRRPGPVKGFSLELVRRIGKGLAGRQGRDFFRPGEIVTEVIHKHGITRKELKSDSRMGHYVAARQELSYRLREECCLSLPQIGMILGGKDHTTVLHGCRRYAAKLAAEASNGG